MRVATDTVVLFDYVLRDDHGHLIDRGSGPGAMAYIHGHDMLVPGLDRVGHRINLGGQVLEFREPLPNAHDVRGTVYWQVLEPERADAVIDQADQLIRGGALAALREDPAAAEADRRDLGARLKLAMNQALRDRGVMVTRVELDFA